MPHLPGHVMGRTARVVIALILLAIAIFVPAWVIRHPAREELRRERAELARVQAENDRLLKQIESLRAEVEALSTDPSAVERRARDELLHVRPDEMVFLFTDAGPTPAKAPVTAGDAGE